MKIRQCFVSNSSSSSFVVKTEGLTDKQFLHVLIEIVWNSYI